MPFLGLLPPAALDQIILRSWQRQQLSSRSYIPILRKAPRRNLHATYVEPYVPHSHKTVVVTEGPKASATSFTLIGCSSLFCREGA